jgi:S1-C subfamily serine protease
MEAGEGEIVEVIVPDGARLDTKVIGFDSDRGFAVLELPSPLPDTAWKFDKGMPGPGSVLLSVAHPSDDGAEVRLNIVRIAKGEANDEDSYIQVDGAAFPGFSGGALVTPSGILAGVIAVEGAANRGWAMPAARAAALVDSIVAKGFPSRAWLGVSTVSIDPPTAWKSMLGESDTGVMVAAVQDNSPAASAGILPGDVLVSIGGKPVGSPDELRGILGSFAPGKTLPLVMIRGGQHKESEVTLGERRNDEGERGPGNHHHKAGHGHHEGKGSGDCCGGHGHDGGHHHQGGGDGCGCSTGR